MEKCKEASSPMTTSTYLDLDEKCKSIYESRYRGIIGSLLYLTTVDQILCLVFACVQDISP